MNNKILLLSVAVLTIGLFAMPTTLSLFNGQHTFVSSSNVSCVGCHADIASELINQKSGTVNSSTTMTRIHLVALNISTGGGPNAGGQASVDLSNANYACLACHGRAAVTITGGVPLSVIGNYSRGVNTSAHAATAIACVACHNAYINDTGAGVTGSAGAHPFMNGSESHAAFVNSTTPGPYLVASNAACIGCHTMPTGGNYVNISRTAKRLTVNVTEDVSGNYGTWSVAGNAT